MSDARQQKDEHGAQEEVAGLEGKGSGTIRRDNPREQGAIGLAQAIAWFARNGYEVSLPISEAQRYDLVVEDEHGGLKKVEVKTTTCRNPRGRYVVQIATSGGNQS